jgi:hypothetical protein
MKVSGLEKLIDLFGSRPFLKRVSIRRAISLYCHIHVQVFLMFLTLLVLGITLRQLIP